MAMGQQKDRQGDLMVSWSEMPRSPGHVFYDRLQLVLIEGGFDGFAEAVCQPYYAARMGAPSVPPGRYFRMHLAGYFEGIDSERGLEWRCSDSLSLREFLLLEMRERVPDHSWLSRTRARLPHEVHTAVFDWVLALIAEAGLVKGERIGVDASTMEANAALRNIVRRDTGEGYRGMLERLARESGIETPTAEDLARLDRKRMCRQSPANLSPPNFPIVTGNGQGILRELTRQRSKERETIVVRLGERPKKAVFTARRSQASAPRVFDSACSAFIGLGVAEGDEVRHRLGSWSRSRKPWASSAKVAAARSVTVCRVSPGRSRSGSDIAHLSLSRVAPSARSSSVNSCVTLTLFVQLVRMRNRTMSETISSGGFSKASAYCRN